MLNQFVYTFVFLIMIISSGATQNLSSHQWEDRLIIILVDDSASEAYKRQLAEFQDHDKGLKERRLVVYQSLPDLYKTGLGQTGNWEKSGELYSRFKKFDSEIEVILIGLDGYIKLHKTEVLPCDELFGIIDQMPMRRYEIESKRKP